MKLLRELASVYSWKFPLVLAYMLQSTEYQAAPYLEWFWRTGDFSRIIYRRTLDKTKAAKLLLLALYGGITLQIIAGITVWALWQWQLGLAIILSYPVVWAHLVVLPLILGRWLIVKPRETKLIRQSERIFKSHTGEKLAIVGSYGKTSMKELLLTVLSEGKKVAATPANKNVAISHAYFARKLAGNEDIIIIEYGEGAPGDVARFAATTHPTRAIITGIAPAHLDQYKDLQQAAQDIFSVTRYVEPDKVYINADSPATKPYVQNASQVYTSAGTLGWKVANIKVTLEGTQFSLVKGKCRIALASKLVGRHHVGPLAFAAALAEELGLTESQIKAGIAKTTPFEHRMQPYPLAGAWIIDDTYNGNIEGIRAGTALLKELDAARKIYVTPGLVAQGVETERVHIEMGALIAAAEPDQVVLMRNSVTACIQQGLDRAGFAGDLVLIDDPLTYYTNLQLVIAAGDVVMMQNDWTDNYK